MAAEGSRWNPGAGITLQSGAAKVHRAASLFRRSRGLRRTVACGQHPQSSHCRRGDAGAAGHIPNKSRQQPQHPAHLPMRGCSRSGRSIVLATPMTERREPLRPGQSKRLYNTVCGDGKRVQGSGTCGLNRGEMTEHPCAPTVRRRFQHGLRGRAQSIGSEGL